jgi:hypothetical protein
MKSGFRCTALVAALFFWGQTGLFAYTDSAAISILTCSPGTELYSKFGHSAIRVYDPYDGTDIVFNYGLFDFNTPNFYLKFIRGKLPYQLGVQRFYSFMWDYQSEGREVKETPLQLDLASRRKLLDFLAYNYLPEHRQYPYDFFFDNCASRIRDVLEQSAAMTYKRSAALGEQKTFRQLLDVYIQRYPWIDFGIDLILGLPSDQTADFRAEMFLPDYLADNLQAGVAGRKPIAGKPVLLLEEMPMTTAGILLPPPSIFFSLVFLGIVLLTWKGPVRLQRAVDILLFGILGLSGTLFTFMWAGTDHLATHANLNLLWATPFALGAAAAVLFNGRRFWFKAVFATTLLALIGFYILPQQLHPATIPIMLASLLRCGVQMGLTFPKVSASPQKAGPPSGVE